MVEISQELAQFAQARMQENAAVWIELGGCRSFDEMFACQQRFAERAVKQYAEETEKLSRAFMGMAGATMPLVQRDVASA